MQFVKQPISADFLCKVCGDAWDVDTAVCCVDCQSAFCGACHDEAMMKEQTCHACSKKPATFGPVHRLVRSMASNLEVYCRYHAHGCSWQGARTLYAAHCESCTHKPKEFTYVNESAVPSDLQCPICSSPFIDPVQLPCEHVFCRSCAVECLKRQPKCPVDRNDATESQLTAAPKLVLEMLDELQVYCANRNAKPVGCTWTGRRRDYIGHRAQCKALQQQPQPQPPVTSTSTTTDPSSTSDRMRLDLVTEFPTIEATNTEQDIYCMAHMTAPELKDLSQRKKPLSISAVIDVSGSMSGGKLQMAQESLKFMIDELTDRDELGIITFHT